MIDADTGAVTLRNPWNSPQAQVFYGGEFILPFDDFFNNYNGVAVQQ